MKCGKESLPRLVCWSVVPVGKGWKEQVKGEGGGG